MPHQAKHRRSALAQALTTHTEVLAQELLGQPVQRSGHEWRYGRRGSLALQVGGSRRGQWYSHETEHGGGPLGLIAWVQGTSVDDAESWARQWLGGVVDPPPPGSPSNADQAETARKATRARRLAAAGVPAADAPPAVRYLASRGIETVPPDWRYTEDPAWIEPPATGALIVPAACPESTVRAVQRIYLAGDVQAPIPALNGGSKRTTGRQAGAVVRLPGDTAGPLILADGPETGASLWVATACEVWVALGSIRKVIEAVPGGRNVVLARDHDPADSSANRALEQALTELTDGARRVWVATPEHPGDDWNDVLVRAGMATIRNGLASAVLRVAGPPAPRYPDTTVPLDEARQTARDEIEAWFREAHGWHACGRDTPPQWLVGISTGGGKSAIAREIAARRLDYHRLYVDYRRNVNDHAAMARGVIAVPTHSLARETVADLRRHGLSAMVWRGREQADENGETACRNLDAVHDAITAHADIELAVCRRRPRDGTEIRCPLYDVCAYQAQKAEAEFADVVVTTHAALFHGRPAAIGERGWLIIDESPCDQALRGLGRDSVIALDTLGRPADPGSEAAWLTRTRAALQNAVAGLPDGPVPLDPVRQAGITAETARKAARIEERYRVDADIRPDLASQDRKQRAQAAGPVNAEIVRRARIWRLLGDALEAGRDHAGGVRLTDVKTGAGRVRALDLVWTAEIGSHWPEATLYLDATPRPALARRPLPRLEQRAHLDIEAPHVRVRQVPDAPTSRHKTDTVGRRKRDACTAWRHLRDIHAYVQAEARCQDGRRVLVIAQEHAETALRTFTWRPNVELAHFNAIKGLDWWRDVGAIIVLGRPLPGPDTIERITAAYTNAAPTSRPAARNGRWYDRETAGLRRADGQGTAITVDIHPDPLCEDVRRSICEDELMQAIGRGRGVNRSAADPLDVHLLTDVCLPLTVEAVRSWDEVRPDMRALQLARGVAVESASHAAQLYPDLWPSASAAREAARQERRVRNALGESPMAVLTHLVAGTYQREAQGAREVSFEVDAAMTPDPARALEDALGTLASCAYDVSRVSTTYEQARRRARAPETTRVASTSGEVVSAGTVAGVAIEGFRGWRTDVPQPGPGAVARVPS